MEGFIAEDVARQGGVRAGPIKLLIGAQGKSGGFGLAHLEANASRIRQITSLGFRDAHAYVRHIISAPTMIARQSDGRIALVRETGADFHILICQWDETLSLWSVTTAIPKRHARGIMPFWKKQAAGESEPRR